MDSWACFLFFLFEFVISFNRRRFLKILGAGAIFSKFSQ